MKRTVVSMAKRTEHHLLSGKLYYIDRRLERRGPNVYLDRSYVLHESVAGIRSIILPEQHLWVIFFEGRGGQPEILAYIHMARILDEGDTLTIEDLYLDVLLRGDGKWQLVDVDEFRRALTGGELSPMQTEAALRGLENACRLVDHYGTALEAGLQDQLAEKELSGGLG